MGIVKAMVIVLVFFRCINGNYTFADEYLKGQTVTDWHVHVAGLGYGGSGNFVNDTMRNNFRFRFFMKWMNVSEDELEKYGDRIVIERLNADIEQSAYVERAVVLAIDGVVDRETGQLDKANTLYYVDNDFVAGETRKYPKLLFGASINPYRENSLELLEKVHRQGAVVIKWIPSVMRIDPADSRLIPFYTRMAELDIPLLTHTGNENSFPNADNALADPERLVLALESGVTVIAAHVATTGSTSGEPNFERLLSMFPQYQNLYADISSLTQINKLGYLARILKVPGTTARMVYGTDWPLQYFPVVSPWYHVRHIGLQNAWRLGRIENKWDRDVELKQAFGVPHAVFSRTVGRLEDQGE